MSKRKMSRRKFLKGTGTALAVASAAPPLEAAKPQQAAPAPAVPRTAIRALFPINATQLRLHP